MQLLQPILVYSKYCKHSLQLIHYLDNVPEIGNVLLPLCIDPRVNQSGDYITSQDFLSLQEFLGSQGMKISKVPTIVLNKGNNEIILLTGSRAFHWLQQFEMDQEQGGQNRQGEQGDHNRKEQNEQGKLELEGVNPNEMLSFSDSYSMLNSDAVSNQSFQFIDRQFQTIPTLEEQAIGNKEKFCQQKYEELLKEREQC